VSKSTAVVHKPAVPESSLRMGGPIAAGIKFGFLARGELDRARSEIEDHLHIREMIESGEYKEFVEIAAREMPSLRDKEPVDALFSLCATSRATYDRREKDIQALGVQSISQLRTMGLSWKEVRMLAEAPEGARREAKALMDKPSLTRDDLEPILGKLYETMEAKLREKQRADTADVLREKAEGKIKGLQEKVIAGQEEVKKVMAELKDARSGRRTSDEKEIDAAVTQAEKLIAQAVAVVGPLDFDHSPHARAKCIELIDTLRTVASKLQVEYANIVEEAE